ncbi:MAG: VWA domain-containing protein [Gemmatimonadaceae bacterium]
MKSQVILDYQQADGRAGYAVRALLKFEGDSVENPREVPLNLSLVLDRSGSMSGEKLEHARKAAAFLVRRLRPADVVSVVAYDDSVITVAEPATGAAQAGLAREIETIMSGGSTNLSGGWLRGRDLVTRNGSSTPDAPAEPGDASRGSAINRVILMTDGHANVGITDPVRLLGLCSNGLKQGVTTTTIGFGGDYDEELLRGMAEAGGGHSYYIENPDQAPGVFEEEIEGLLSLAAQNIEVKIKPEPFVDLVNVHNDYQSHGNTDGITVAVGDLYARDPKSLLIEFFVADVETVGDRSIAVISVTADVVGADGGVQRQEIRIPVAATLSAEGREEPEIQRTKILLDAAKARDEARVRGQRGDYGGAAAMLREASVACASMPLGGSVMDEQAVDLMAMASKYENEEVTLSDEKYLYQRAYNARRGKERYEKKISRVKPQK